MISPVLPAALRAALADRLQGLSRKDAAGRSSRISEVYRAGGSSGTIKSDADALAYALVRMPATYAAVVASLNALTAAIPDFTPESLLDVGSGPGTASWAAAEVFPSLQECTQLDANRSLGSLALELAHASERFVDLRYLPGDAGANLAEMSSADLVIASYVVGEMSDHERRALARAMWSKARHALLVIEPGTPAGYARMLALRAELIEAGAYVAAPCPHENSCPLAQPDWCHFAQRLPRSQAHRQIKGAELPFEDEKFSYVALTRVPPPSRKARVLAQPTRSKVEITAKLCTVHGLDHMRVPRRDKAAYASARRWSWGDGA